MNDQIEKDMAVTAAFLMSGLYQAGMHAVLERWGCGFVELVEELVSHAEPMTLYSYVVADKHGENYPGVFAYEVAEPFGAWFGEYVKLNGHAPSANYATDKFMDMTETFFNQ